MILTGIQETKKGRFSLFLDGEFVFSIHSDIYYSHGNLHVGDVWSSEELENLHREDEIHSAREKALDYLERSEKTEKMLRDKLLQYYSEEAVDTVLTRLKELGLINDLEYGKRFAADCINLRYYPLRRIREELKKKGIDEAVIETLMSNYGEEDERHTLQRMIEKKCRKLPKTFQEKEKLIGSLARRGFPISVIRDVLKELLTEEDRILVADGEEWAGESENLETIIIQYLTGKYRNKLKTKADREKTMAALYRKGLPLEAIRHGMKRLKEENPELFIESEDDDNG